MSESGQNAKYSSGADVFCFASINRHPAVGPAGPFGARSGLVSRSNQRLYSITSSARASSEGGMVRPSALALLRLTTSSIRVGCSTGRSPRTVPCGRLSTWPKEAGRKYVTIASSVHLRPRRAARQRLEPVSGSLCPRHHPCPSRSVNKHHAGTRDG